jgi:type IV secretory pathway VirB2 component (pilin)
MKTKQYNMRLSINLVQPLKQHNIRSRLNYILSKLYYFIFRSSKIVILFSFFLSTRAFAQSSDYATQFIYNICSYASGNIARALAVLAIMFLGYRCFRGQFDGHYLFFIIVGLALIIGGSYYGKTVLLGGV